MSRRKPPLFALLFLMPFASISAVLFTPALPEIAHLLSLTPAEAQSTMSLFLLGYALGSLPYGPLANRWGRKPALYLGASLAVVGSLLSLFGVEEGNFPLLLFGRFLTALGSSAGMKLSFTMIADTFDRREATQKLSLASLAFAIAPGAAVAIGGFLTTEWGWQSAFGAVITYSLLVLLIAFFLPETAPALDPEALQLQKIKGGYFNTLRQPKIVLSSLLMGSVTSVIYLFSTFAPFLAIEEMGLSPEDYGLLNTLPPLGLIAGSLMTHWLALYREKLWVIRLGGGLSFFCSVGMLALFAAGKLSPITLFLPIPLLYFGTALIYNNASSFAMEHMKDKSNGSAIMGCLNIFFAASSVFLAQSIASPSSFLLPLSFMTLSLLSLLLLRSVSRLG